MRPKLQDIDFSDTVEVIDPDQKGFQNALAHKAAKVADAMLEDALESGEDKVSLKASALNSYTKYRNMLNNDVGSILEKLALMDDKKLAVLEKLFKQRTAVEQFKQGKMDLEEIYNLPKKKKKR